MLANSDFHKSLPRDSREPEQNAGTISSIPEAAARLQLLASSPVADLEAIASVIRNDFGLTIGLLQLAEEIVEENSGTLSVEELVIHLGLEQLRRMAAEAALLRKT